MKVERDGPARVRQAPFGDDERRTGAGNQLRGEPAPLEHPRKRVGVAFDVRRVCGDVWNRQQVEQLSKNFLLVLLAPGADLRDDVGRRCGEEKSGGEGADETSHGRGLCALPVSAALRSLKYCT